MLELSHLQREKSPLPGSEVRTKKAAIDLTWSASQSTRRRFRIESSFCIKRAAKEFA